MIIIITTITLVLIKTLLKEEAYLTIVNLP